MATCAAAAVSHARTLDGTKQRVRDRHGASGERGRGCRLPRAAALKAGKSRPAVQAAIEAVTASSRLPIDDALADERAVFQRLRVSREAAALRHQFFAERESAKHPALDGSTAAQGAITSPSSAPARWALASPSPRWMPAIDVLLLEQDGGGAGAGREPHPRALREPRARGKMKATVAADREARLRSSLDWDALADRRPRHRGRVRGAGGQEAGLPAHRRGGKARRHSRHQHSLPRPRRDRRRHVTPAGRDRPALLLARQRDAADGGRARPRQAPDALATALALGKQAEEAAAC